jgi:chitinase
LRITAEKGRYLQPFARLLLAVAALRDHDKTQGNRLLQSLAAEFPHNHLYREELSRLR